MTARGIAILVVVLLGAAVARAEPGRYALVVGANAGDRDEVVLRYAESDAHRVARVLRTIGGFQPEDVLVLTAVGAEDLRRALIVLNARIRQGPPSALLVVFYSGHADGEALHLGGTRLATSELRGLVAGSAAAARVLIVDACRSGALTRVKGGRAGASFDVRLEAPPAAAGLAILTSSAAGEDAQESDQLGASFFTHHLVSALMGAADRDRDGRVTLGEAFAYTAERTLTTTARTVGGPQHPTYRYELGGRDDLVLARPGGRHRNLGTLEFPRPGTYLIHRGRSTGPVVAELSTDQPGRRLVVEAGSYGITRRDADHLLEGAVVVTPGSTQGVRPESMRRIEYARVVRKGGTERRHAFSLFVMGGARGELLALGTAWRSDLGARVDLRPLSLELRLGAGGAAHENRRHTISSHELAASMAALRGFDLGRATLSAGLEAGGAWLHQRFLAPATLPPGVFPPSPGRDSLGFFMGPTAVVELPVMGRLYLRLDGAAPTYFLSTATDGGAGRISTVVTYRVTAGLGRFF